MRIIGNIEHPFLKISVFKNDGRTSLKFENEGSELTFKLGQDERLASVESIKNWMDEPFLEAVLENFKSMNQAKLQAMTRRFPQPDEIFEVIL